jgi:hypothetical protein
LVTRRRGWAGWLPWAFEDVAVVGDADVSPALVGHLVEEVLQGGACAVLDGVGGVLDAVVWVGHAGSRHAKGPVLPGHLLRVKHTLCFSRSRAQLDMLFYIAAPGLLSAGSPGHRGGVTQDASTRSCWRTSRGNG